MGIMAVSDGGRIHGWWNQFHRVIQRTGIGLHTDFSAGNEAQPTTLSSVPNSNVKV